MGFIQVATTDQIPLGSMKAYIVNNKDILVTNYKGKYYAMNLKCTHMGGNLSKGSLEGNVVTCPRHGAKFDVTSGLCISGPKLGLVKPDIKDEITYIVKLEGDNILIDLKPI